MDDEKEVTEETTPEEEVTDETALGEETLEGMDGSEEEKEFE